MLPLSSSHAGPGADFEKTIEVTFQHLQSVLADAVAVLPVRESRELLSLLPQCSDETARLLIAELIKLDMNKALSQRQMRRLTFYGTCLRQHFENGQPPLDLVLEELQVRRALGDKFTLPELQRLYPHLQGVLSDVVTRVESTHQVAAPEKAPQLKDGERIDDFTILQALGKGGFANVYLARQNSMQRLVALKVSHCGSDEPIALSQLDHPNIVRVYDQRVLGHPPMVLLYMQYVPGGTLADVIRSTANAKVTDLSGQALLASIDQALVAAGQQAPEQSSARLQLSQMNWAQTVAWLGIRLAEGLAAAHQAGIMHRDIKPANILLTSEGVPKLADFNVSFSSQAGCAGASVYFGGSLVYMSPEQLKAADRTDAFSAEHLDARSDVYSLAMVLWELWQGQRPVRMTELVWNWQEAVQQQIKMRHQSPKVIWPARSAADRVLERTLRHALEFDRDRRPVDAKEFAGRLKLALSQRSAELFDPGARSIKSYLRTWPAIFTTAVMIFIPNGLAGALNYQYNLNSIRTKYPQLESDFTWFSFWVNCIAFPIGACVLIWLGSFVQGALNRARRHQPASRVELNAAWNLGHRAAMVGGMLWVLAGFLFPLAIQQLEPKFAMIDCIEMFMSMVICGGIAWIYPFFGISLLASEIYYPTLVSNSMQDIDFRKRAKRMHRRSLTYLASAAVIPLVALALLALRQSDESTATIRIFLLITVVLTAIALLVAFLAHQRIQQTIDYLDEVLGSGR